MTVVLTALVCWAASGIVIAGVLSRHGHNFWLLATIGLGYGPFLVLIWLRGAAGQRLDRHVVTMPERSSEGWIDVLIGLDGSAASVRSTKRVLDKLGPSLGRVQITSVLDHELFNAPDAFEVDERRIAYLEEAAEHLALAHAEVTLIAGEPDAALRRHATEDNFDLIIVAHRPSSAVRALQGSTSKRLSVRSKTPVLICPPVEDDA